MFVRVMLKNRKNLLFKDVYKVSNLSCNFNNDCLHIVTYYDLPDKGTLLDFKDILCFDIRNVLCATNMYSLCSSSECISCKYFDCEKLKCNLGGNKNEFKKIK